MKITQKHIDILNAVRKTYYPMRHKIVGLNGTKGRTFDSLVRFGYLQAVLDTMTGSTSVKLTSKGIAEVMEDAYALENRPMIERVAERVKGLSIPDLIEAGVEYDTAVYSNVANILKNS